MNLSMKRRNFLKYLGFAPAVPFVAPAAAAETYEFTEVAVNIGSPSLTEMVQSSLRAQMSSLAENIFNQNALYGFLKKDGLLSIETVDHGRSFGDANLQDDEECDEDY